MPDDQLIHPAFGHSEKVNKLTALERDVWLFFKLAADDFGVMRFSATPLQDLARWLEQMPARKVQRALAAVCGVGLIQSFDHQGQPYVFDPAWQTWQKITHPRATKQPAPTLDRLDRNTRWLFTLHQNGGRLSGWRAPDEWTDQAGNASGELPDSSAPVFVGNGCVGGSGVMGNSRSKETGAENAPVSANCGKPVENLG